MSHMYIFKRLFVFCSLLAISSISFAEKRVALVIGNSDYSTPTFPYLSTPVNDAKEIGNVLFSLGFDTIRVIDGNRMDLLGAINRFNSMTDNADVGVFYYSGHATNIDYVNYLVPSKTYLNISTLSDECVNLNNIISMMDRNCKLAFLFLDACRSEMPVDGPKKGIVSPRGFVDKETNVTEPVGCMVCYATENGRTATTGHGSLSPFTASLAKYLTDGREFREVWYSIKSEVSTSCNQKPVNDGSYTKSFYFNKIGAESSNIGTLIAQSQNISINTSSSSILTGKYLNHEFVDLGLPSGVLWATCNVGASSPCECGFYFAWGELVAKKSYTWNSYLDTDNDGHSFVKYNGLKTSLSNEDDAATFNWGGDWRIPTQIEMKELASLCSWNWSTYNGVEGYLVTGPNGNSVFFPLTGWVVDKEIVLPNSGTYWSSMLYTNLMSCSWCLSFNKDEIDASSYDDRYRGRSIRPVRSSFYRSIVVVPEDSSKILVSGTGKYLEGTTVFISAVAKNGYHFTRWNDGNEDNPRQITVSNNVTFVASFASDYDPSLPGNGCVYGHEYIDLGLPSGVKWATCNVGALSPEEYGDYFSWGEIDTKINFYWETYHLCERWFNSLTKYCIDSKDGYKGFTDGKKTLEKNDDAASMNWGGAWRMPTYDEFRELKKKCRWEWTTINGKRGYKVIGPNGNSIFLPAAGYNAENMGLCQVGNIGNYWSSSLDRDNFSNWAHFLAFGSKHVVVQSTYRDLGLVVRPVCN